MNSGCESDYTTAEHIRKFLSVS